MKIIVFSIFVLVHIINNYVNTAICPCPFELTPPEASQINYYWYSNENSINPVQLYVGQINEVIDSYDTTCPTVFITHGFNQNANVSWILNMKDAFLQKGCYNIIAIDWSQISSVYNYSLAISYINLVYPYTACRTCQVGQLVAQLQIEMNYVLGIPFSDMNMVGHSLGAHLFGCAGKEIIKQESSTIGKIFGLDPAGPCFYSANDRENCGLSSDAATFVIVIHTDIFGFGNPYPMGQLDFFPNGGTLQPGCPSTNYGPLIYCNHEYACILGTASILTNTFISTSCSNYLTYESFTNPCAHNPKTLMGYFADIHVSGIFYLDTTATPNYSMNGARRSDSIIG